MKTSSPRSSPRRARVAMTSSASIPRSTRTGTWKPSKTLRMTSIWGTRSTGISAIGWPCIRRRCPTERRAPHRRRPPRGSRAFGRVPDSRGRGRSRRPRWSTGPRVRSSRESRGRPGRSGSTRPGCRTSGESRGRPQDVPTPRPSRGNRRQLPRILPTPGTKTHLAIQAHRDSSFWGSRDGLRAAIEGQETGHRPHPRPPGTPPV